MSNDRYENIRKALAMGPTAGPWSEYANHRRRPYIAGADGSLIAFIESDDDVEDANAAHIAACDPDTIRELLSERDQLAAALDALRAEVEFLRRGIVPRDDDMIVPVKLLDEINASGAEWKDRAERLAEEVEALRAEVDLRDSVIATHAADTREYQKRISQAEARADKLRAEVERLWEIMRPKREKECLTLDHWRTRAYYLEANWSRCSRACAVEQTKREEAEARAERLAEALDIIARVGKASRNKTTRTLWIVARAISALNGDEDWQALPKPKGFHDALLHPTAAQENGDA